MTEEEIMTRAREAFLAVCVGSNSWERAARMGMQDENAAIKTAARALRDSDKPVTLPVDPDMLEARGIWQATLKRGYADDPLAGLTDVLRGIKRGRELERGAR